MSTDAIRPEAQARERLFATDDGGPLVMVNFLKFKPGGGAKEYGRYGSAFAKLLTERGGRFIYTGRVVQRMIGEEEWHAVAVVEYPSRKAFVEITSSAEYQKIHPHREDGLEKTLLYATTPVTV